MTKLALLVACALAACSPALDDATVFIGCDDGVCPSGYTCSSVGACVHGASTAALDVVSATAVSPTSIVVTFSQPYVPSYALESARYTLTAGVTVSVVEPDSATTLRLTTSTMQSRHYTLTIAADMVDIYGDPIGTRVTSFLGQGDFVDEQAPALLTPADMAETASLTVDLAWAYVVGATRYQIDIATDAAFTQPIPSSPFTVDAPSARTPPATTTTVTVPAADSYYWRVIADTTFAPPATPGRFFQRQASIYVYCAAGNDCDAPGWENGNRATPFRSITRAVAEASLRPIPQTIRVAARTDDGSSAYADAVDILRTMSVLGGYGPDFSEPAAPSSHRTVISASTPVRLVGVSFSVLDGFTILPATADTTSLRLAACDGTTVVSRVIADATTITSLPGSGPHLDTVTVTTLNIDGGAPHLVHVTATGDTTLLRTDGAELSDFTGRAFSGGGTFHMSDSHTLNLAMAGNGLVEDTIIAGSASLVSGTLTMRNCVVRSSEPEGALLEIDESVTAVVANTTVFGHVQLLEGSSTSTLVNLLVFCATPSDGAVIQGDPTTMTLGADNVVAVGCAGVYCPMSVGHLGECVGPAEVPSADANFRFDGSAQVDATPAAVFTSTTDDAWQLLPDSIGVLAINHGGKDAAASTCGVAANTSCGNVTDDLHGAARSAPYSVGATESAP